MFAMPTFSPLGFRGDEAATPSLCEASQRSHATHACAPGFSESVSMYAFVWDPGEAQQVETERIKSRGLTHVGLVAATRQLFHETKLLNSALQRGPVRPCRGPDGTGPSTPIMAATPVAVSATVAPDSHHEHGLQVTVFTEAHDR